MKIVTNPFRGGSEPLHPEAPYPSVAAQRVAGRDAGSWAARERDLRTAVRTHLWTGSQFVPHIYLDKGSPFPADFDESGRNVPETTLKTEIWPPYWSETAVIPTVPGTATSKLMSKFSLSAGAM